MGYLDVYKNRVNSLGTTPEQRAITKGEKAFARLLQRSPQTTDLYNYDLDNSIVVTTGKQVVMQYSTIDTYKTFRYVMSKLEDPIQIGSIIAEKNTIDYTIDQYNPVEEYSYWIIMREEAHPVLSYHQYIALRCNTILHTYDWYDSTKELNIPVHIIDTAAAGRYNERFLILKDEIISRTDKSIQIIGSPLVNYKNYNKFIIEGDGWKVVEVDKISVPNLYFISLTETALSEDDIDSSDNTLIIPNDWTISFDTTNASTIYTGIPKPIKVYIYKNGVLTEEEFATNCSTGSSYINGRFTSNALGMASLKVNLVESPSINNTLYMNTITPTGYNYFLNGATTLRNAGRYKYKLTKYIDNTETNFNGDLSVNSSVSGLISYSYITNGAFEINVNARGLTGTSILHFEDDDGSLDTTLTIVE